MYKFWEEHATEDNMKVIMLDDKTDLTRQVEIPEILGLLPDISGKDVLELGAGIG